MSILHPDARPTYEPPRLRSPWPLAGAVALAVVALGLVAGALVAVQVVYALQEPGGMAGAQWPW